MMMKMIVNHTRKLRYVMDIRNAAHGNSFLT